MNFNHNEIRVGINPSSLFTASAVLKFAKKIDEKLKVETIWIPESWGRDAFVTLGALSQITSRVKLGTSVVSIYSRSPASVAMAASTLDNISKNRTIIGLGASTPMLAEKWHGVNFDKPLLRMKEFVECFKNIVTGQTASYHGNFFSVSDFKIMHPSSRNAIPVFLGAVNSGMINLATKIADGVIFYMRPFEELKKIAELIRLKVQKERKKFQISSVFVTAISNKNPEMARERATKTIAFYIAVGKYYNSFLVSHGFEKEVREITLEYYENGINSAKNCVPHKMLDSLAICGDFETCIKTLNKFTSTGIFPILQVNPVDIDETEKTINESLDFLNLI